MSGLLWFYVIWLVVASITIVAQVGKPKKPTTPGVAAGVVAIYALTIAATFYFGWGLS